MDLILLVIIIAANIALWWRYRLCPMKANRDLERDNRDLCQYVFEVETDNKRLASYCLELQRRLEHRNKLRPELVEGPAVEIERIERNNWSFWVMVNLN